MGQTATGGGGRRRRIAIICNYVTEIYYCSSIFAVEYVVMRKVQEK